MLQGRYIGPIKILKGETALLRFIAAGEVLAQFDNVERLSRLDSETRWAHDWHRFDGADFIVFEEHENPISGVLRIAVLGFIAFWLAFLFAVIYLIRWLW